ncbi:TRIM71 [Mytilus coruscus]|uniref:TRIM71 n=1 Tax=Mytilus coruscus TaxID=42192 RepID=A0A6J8B7G1_MYTCO|nr:TRIM71 [Mytilus coruscus]
MATKNAVNLITELERRYLECNICTELFDEDKRIPRLLPCHHPFCSECLKRLGHRKDTIKCPTCNAVHKVKKNGPSDFPKDNTRRDLTSFLQVHSDLNSFKKCCLCGNTVDVTYKCQQCNINLCESCRCQHETENRTHNAIVNKSETFQDEDLDVCQNPDHERAKLKYFCNSSNCQSVLCPSCVIAEHRDINKHELEDIEEAFKKRKQELGDDVKSLRTRVSHVKATVQNVLDKTNTLQDEKNEFLKMWMPYITEVLKKESNEDSRKHNLDSFLQNASECCSLSEQLINHDSKSSFLNVHQTIDVHVKRYLNTPVEDSTYDENDVEKNIDFNDNLQMFKRDVEVLENTRREENVEPLIEPANVTGLKFNTEVTSQFPCRSADNQTVATKPSGNMLCGSTRRLFKSGTNSHFAEARFILNYQPSNFTLNFLSEHKTNKRKSDLHRFQHLELRSPLWPVFAAYTKTAVSMIIKTNQVGFDRFTLHPNLYISDDDKKISNKRLSGTFPSDSFGFPVIFTRPKQFLTSSYIQTKINIDFAESNKGEILFKIGIGKQEDGAFKATPLFECTKCALTYVYGFYHTNGYCLSSTNDSNVIAVGSQISLFLHYDRNGIIEVYTLGYYFGYSYHIFQLEPFHNVHPRIYIEKYSAKDIVISTSENADLLNLKSLFLGLLSVVLILFV